MVRKSMLEKQGNLETVKKLEEVLSRLKTKSTTEAFIIAQETNIHELTACVIGLKKDLAEISNRVAVLDTKLKIANAISSKIGLALLGCILTAIGGLVVLGVQWMLTK